MLVETDQQFNTRRGSGAYVWHIRLGEVCGMLAVTLLLLWIFHNVIEGRAEFRADSVGRLSHGEVLNINHANVKSLRDMLAPAFSSAEEANAASDAIGNSGRQFPRVGALNELLRDDGSSWFPPHRVAQLKSTLIVRGPEEWDAHFRASKLRLLFSFWVYVVLASLLRSKASQILVPVVAACAGIGVAVQAGLADPMRDTMTFENLTAMLPLCTGLLLAGSLVSVERVGANLVKTYVSVAAVLALLLVVFGTSPVPGVKINLGPVQPGEFVRLLTVAAMASVLAKRWLTVRAAPLRLPLGLQVPNFHDGIAYFGAFISLVFLVCKDQGPALITALLMLAMYCVAAGSGRAAIAVLVAVALLALVLPVIAPHIFETAAGRVTAMLHPTDNMVRGGGHLLEMLFTYAAGGWRGQGLGRGWSHLLPAAATDGVLPAAGEAGGFVLVAFTFGLITMLVVCGYHIARRAQSEFGFFLVFGVSTLIAIQSIMIAAGTLGVLPLTGVTTPFLSYGGSSQLAMFLAVALMLSVSARTVETEENTPFLKPQRIVQRLLAAGLVLCLVKVGYVAWNADQISRTLGRTRAWNGTGSAPVTNPRLAALAGLVKRGSIVGADGLIFATNDFNELLPLASRYRAVGIDVRKVRPSGGRYYPAGGIGFALLGDTGHAYEQFRNDTAAEWMYNETLRGWREDDLIYLLRHRRDSGDPHVQRLLHGNRSVKLTVGFEAQYRAGVELDMEMKRLHPGKGAVVIGMDPANGEIRVALVYPFPQGEPDPSTVRDLARNGMFPPGSIFKIVTATSAERNEPEALGRTYVCRRVPGGVGNYLEKTGLMVHDDPGNKVPHGQAVDWKTGLRVSCNATFAAVAECLQQEDLRETSALFGIRLGELTDAEKAMVGFGQGPVAVTPAQAMQFAAPAANGGKLVFPHLVAGEGAAPVQVVNAEFARELATAERSVVTDGTALSLRDDPLLFYGKTGSAQWKKGAEAHAWFVGSTGYGSQQPSLSFAVLVLRGGHGGSAAAPLAAKVLRYVVR